MEATMTKVPLSRRINFRMITFGVVMLALIGYPTYLFVDEAVSGGIHKKGDLSVVNLQAMSTFNFDQQNGTAEQIPSQWRALDGKRIQVEGEMWAGGSSAPEVNMFDLVYSKTKCCFSGPPLVQHFVKASANGRAIPFFNDDRVTVTGILHITVKKGPEGVESVYSLDVEQIAPL